MKLLITYFLFLILFISCNVKSEEINYGEDICNYCSMTIVDRLHAAELVTNKGKVFKFDATECMINHLSENKSVVSLYLTTDYLNPEKLIDARKAYYIISPNIPSPMRANLSALATKEAALSLRADKQGELFTWEELLIHLSQNSNVSNRE